MPPKTKKSSGAAAPPKKKKPAAKKPAANKTPLFLACQKGDVDAARSLLAEGAEVDRATEDGRTPLYIASQRGHVDAARLLLEKGAEVDRATEWAETPLNAACDLGYVDAARLLLDKGAKVDWATKEGATPLWSACKHGDVDLVQLLLARGADVKWVNQRRTPLHIAKEFGHSSIIALLLPVSLVNRLQALDVGASRTKIDALNELYEHFLESRPPWDRAAYIHGAGTVLFVDAGGIEPLVEFLQQKDCRRKAAQCLTIILQDYWHHKYGNGAKDAVVAEGAIPPLVSMLRSREITSGASSEPEKRAAAEALKWLVRGHEGEAARAGVLEACVAIMQEKRPVGKTMQGRLPLQTVTHAVWVLYYLADASPENRRAIMEAGGMFHCLVKLAKTDFFSIREQEDLFKMCNPDLLLSQVTSLKRKLSLREGTKHDDDSSVSSSDSSDDRFWTRNLDPDSILSFSQVRALKSENASLKAELARVKDREEKSFQNGITRLEWLLDRTDAWKPHEHSEGVIALGFGLGALRGRATTLTDATLDPRMWQILDAALDVGRRGIEEAEWRHVQTIYVMKNNRRGVHTDAKNIGRSYIISFGDYSDAADPTAGRLSTNNGILNTYRQMCSFYAQDPHAVLRYDNEGTRYTVAYFRTVRDYDEDLREQLNSRGFGLLPAVKGEGFCHICAENTKRSGDSIILCDGNHGQCTAEVHLSCLDDRADRSPDDDWFCSVCREPSPTSDDPVDNCRVDLTELDGNGRLTETARKRLQKSMDATDPEELSKRLKPDPG